MSLISLTFGKNNQMPSFSQIDIIRPCDSIHPSSDVENKVEVKKACTFFGSRDVYIVGEMVSGVAQEEMTGQCNGKEFEIKEVESKLGAVAKQGMNVGLSLSGVSLDDLKAGDVITLSIR